MGAIIQKRIKYGSGNDGFSPIVTVTDIENGHKVDVRDINGVKSFEVLNGADGIDAPCDGLMFTSLEELGLTAPVSIGEVFNAMPDKSQLMLNVNNSANADATVTDAPHNQGVLVINKHNSGRFSIEFNYSLGGNGNTIRKWIGTLKGSDGTGLNWKEVAYLNDHAIKSYSSLSDLELDTTATINDIVSKMANTSMFVYKTDVFDLSQYENLQFATVTIIKQSANRVQAIMTDKDTGNLYIGYMDSANKFIGWRKIITEKSDPYACTSYTVLTGTEDLFTLPCGHYASANVDTAYNYPVTDTNTTAHIYVLGCLNEPANNKGYRIILYFDNKNRMYRINEWWGNFSNGWQEIATTADHNMKTYTNVTQLGLTSPCSVVDIIKKLPKNSQLIYGSYGSETHNGGFITDAPAIHGLLEVKKSDYDGCRATMTFTESATNSMGFKRKWVAEFITSSSAITPDKIKWHEVAYKAVADVGFTTINQTNGLTAPTGITMTDGSKVNYCIRNGVCYVHIALQISSISAKINSWTTIAELPTSVIEAVGAMNCESNTVPDCMPIRVSQAGKLTLMYKGTTTSTSDWWSYSFSYPVIE